MSDADSTVPYGYCHCGCGEKTAIADKTRPNLGYIKGIPRKFRRGHNHRRPLEERFWPKVDKAGPDDCWEWQAAKTCDGYGRLTFQRQGHQAHRIAYELLVGEIPEGLQLDHLCRNPSCVNPAHLEPVTCRENVLRGHAYRALIAQCFRGHAFTEENTYWAPNGTRQCIECRRFRAKRHYWQNKAVA